MSVICAEGAADAPRILSELAALRSHITTLQEGQAVLQEGQAVLQQQGRRTEAMNANMTVRAANRASQLSHHELLPLQRERDADPQQPDGPGPGDLPPEGMFPATRGDVEALTPAQLDALSAFYGQAFGGPSIAARRHAFRAFAGFYF